MLIRIPHDPDAPTVCRHCLNPIERESHGDWLTVAGQNIDCPINIGDGHEPPSDPPPNAITNESEPMGILELRAELHARGFREFETVAGWRPIAQFDPYGMAPPDPHYADRPAGLNWAPQWTPYLGTVTTLADGSTVVRDIIKQVPTGITGQFPVRIGLRFVNAYEVSRHYGGPEEGGWWYDAGTPLASIPVMTDSLQETEDAKAKLVAIFADRYADNIDRHSVIGEENFEVYVEENTAAPFPSERPHYE